MVAGPELSRMIEEFEGSVSSTVVHGHHEQNPGFQNTFATDVLHLVASFEELGNPFSEEGEELMAIHSKEIMDSSVVNTVRNARKIGEEQFKTFMKERIVERNKPITEPIKKNNLPTFNVHSKKVVSKDKAKVGVLKQDLALFSRLYVSQVKPEMAIWRSFSNSRINLGHPRYHKRASSEEGRKQISSNACQIAPASAPYNQLSMLPFLMELSSFKC